MITKTSEITADFRKKLDIDLLKRVERSIFFLEQLIKKAYGEELAATHGEAGGIGGIVSEVIQRSDSITGRIGFTKAGDHMKFIEWGVRPGNNAEFPAHAKMPPVKNIYRWLSLARITTPQVFRDRAAANIKRAKSKHKHPAFDKNKNAPWYSSDPQMVFAFFVAQKIKVQGRPALRIMDRVLRANIEKVTKYINGEA